MGRASAKNFLGDFDGALRDAQEAIWTNQHAAGGWAQRGEAKLNLGDFEGAIDDCSKALLIDSRSAYAARTLCIRGNAKLQTGDYNGAYDDARTGRELHVEVADFAEASSIMHQAASHRKTVRAWSLPIVHPGGLRDPTAKPKPSLEERTLGKSSSLPGIKSAGSTLALTGLMVS